MPKLKEQQIGINGVVYTFTPYVNSTGKFYTRAEHVDARIMAAFDLANVSHFEYTKEHGSLPALVQAFTDLATKALQAQTEDKYFIAVEFTVGGDTNDWIRAHHGRQVTTTKGQWHAVNGHGINLKFSAYRERWVNGKAERKEGLNVVVPVPDDDAHTYDQWESLNGLRIRDTGGTFGLKDYAVSIPLTYQNWAVLSDAANAIGAAAYQLSQLFQGPEVLTRALAAGLLPMIQAPAQDEPV